MAVFRAYHVHKRDVANPLELLAIAREVDIDTTVLAEDLRTRKYKKRLGRITKRQVSHTTFWSANDSPRWPGANVCETRSWNLGRVGRPRVLYDLFKFALQPYVLEIKKPASANQAAASAARR